MSRYGKKVLAKAYNTVVIEIGMQCSLDRKFGYHKFRVTISDGIYPRADIEVLDHVFGVYYVKENLHPSTEQKVLRLARVQVAKRREARSKKFGEIRARRREKQKVLQDDALKNMRGKAWNEHD
jgi:hypothetical protein